MRACFRHCREHHAEERLSVRILQSEEAPARLFRAGAFVVSNGMRRLSGKRRRPAMACGAAAANGDGRQRYAGARWSCGDGRRRSCGHGRQWHAREHTQLVGGRRYSDSVASCSERGASSRSESFAASSCCKRASRSLRQRFSSPEPTLMWSSLQRERSVTV